MRCCRPCWFDAPAAGARCAACACERMGSMTTKVPFNKPVAVGSELDNIKDALERGHLAGDGFYTKRCHEWLERRLGSPHALLTHSCTGALEMAAMLCDLEPGDEVIMPSYTFVSTANA